eukprot:3139065-Pleurochrysis_carterae.AAC.4
MQYQVQAATEDAIFRAMSADINQSAYNHTTQVMLRYFLLARNDHDAYCAVDHGIAWIASGSVTDIAAGAWLEALHLRTAQERRNLTVL